MSDGMVQLVELLSVARAKTDLDCPEGRPIVLITVRPHPDRSWAYHNLGLIQGTPFRHWLDHVASVAD